ncbi:MULTISPECIES: hypothetical protein [unclassified Crossiella]|uniref:hypothetical protein n=1 Tax=unclassified Crossiella TaxID=2620835 RepID=UPI001FFF1E82|nr:MULTISPECIES: hypothetical protein [unclassified Crossiella]MCK2240030.1 hypothetical protein [Crossiella sp. S99.2]MCK2252738.1 hypothetical protein [Crossiella sp. S99.1]
MDLLVTYLQHNPGRQQLDRYGDSRFLAESHRQRYWITPDQHGYYDTSQLNLCWKRVDPPQATVDDLIRSLTSICEAFHPGFVSASRLYATAVLNDDIRPARTPADLHWIIHCHFGHPLGADGRLDPMPHPVKGTNCELDDEDWLLGAATIHAISTGHFEDAHPCRHHESTDTPVRTPWLPIDLSLDCLDPLGLDLAQLAHGCAQTCRGDAREAAQLLLAAVG